MTPNKFLKGVEKQAWKSNFKDGLFDLFFGFLLLGNALAVLIDTIWGMSYAGTIGFAVLAAFGGIIVFMGKRLVTVPRIGNITVGPIRLKKIIILMIAIGLAVLSTFALWLLPELIGSTTEEFPIIPIYFFIFIGVIFGSIAYLLDYDRGYIIALVCAVTWGLNELFIFYTDSRIPGGILFALGGISIVTMGLVVFSRFLKIHPLSDHEEGSGKMEEVI